MFWFVICFESMFTVKSIYTYEEIKTIQKSGGRKESFLFPCTSSSLRTSHHTHTTDLEADFWMEWVTYWTEWIPSSGRQSHQRNALHLFFCVWGIIVICIKIFLKMFCKQQRKHNDCGHSCREWWQSGRFQGWLRISNIHVQRQQSYQSTWAGLD